MARSNQCPCFHLTRYESIVQVGTVLVSEERSSCGMASSRMENEMMSTKRHTSEEILAKLHYAGRDESEPEYRVRRL